MQRIFNDVACTVCGCVCDDLQLATEDNRIVDVRHVCQLAEPWFAALNSALAGPTATIHGQSTSFDKAIEHAAEILRSARKPLIFGLSRSSTAGQRAAIALAECLGATIDTPASCNPAATLAMQTVGQSTCSLGEVRNRADLVIFWRVDPLVTHPRHLERYSAEPRGLCVPHGRADRRLIVVDSNPTATSNAADHFLQLEAGHDLAIVDALRKIVRGEVITTTPNDGLAISELQHLAGQLTSCRYGALFFGVGQGSSEESRQVVDALLRLVTDLNKSTRFTAHYIPISDGLVGAETVLCWQTGFPFAVNFASGFPRFDPNAFAANGLLERGEVDACVLIGSEAANKLTSTARQTIQSISSIVLDYPNAEPATDANVHFTTAIYGIHASGTAYRMDGVPIPLRKYIESDYPTDDAILNAIAAKLK